MPTAAHGVANALVEGVVAQPANMGPLAASHAMITIRFISGRLLDTVHWGSERAAQGVRRPRKGEISFRQAEGLVSGCPTAPASRCRGGFAAPGGNSVHSLLP